MTDHLVSPDREIKLGELTLTLSGSFATLRAIQQAFGKDILHLQASVLDMRQDEIAKLISLASGEKEEAIGQTLLDEYGVDSVEYVSVKYELLSWLAVAMTPKRDRKKKSEALAEIVTNLKASLGRNTSDSASESSNGPQPPFGEATSGK